MPRDKSSSSEDNDTGVGKGSYWMLDSSANDMFEQGNYRRRRTRRQRHAKLILTGQFQVSSKIELNCVLREYSNFGLVFADNELFLPLSGYYSTGL